MGGTRGGGQRARTPLKKWYRPRGIQRWEQGARTPPPMKNFKNIGLLSNTDQDTLKNSKATKPACNVGPSSTRHWRAHDDPLIVVFGLKKKKKKRIRA